MRLPNHAIFALSHLTLDRCTFGVIRNFIASSISLHRLYSHLLFLKSCKTLRLLPRFISGIKLPATLNLRQDLRIRTQVLSSCIKSHYSSMAKMRITRQDCETVIHRSLPQHTVSYVIHVALMASKTENETTRQAHEKKINALLESRGTSTTSSDGPLPDPEATPRISIIGEATLNADATRILAMGPKFIPSLQLNRKTADELRISLAHVAYQLRWKGHFSNSRYTTTGTPAEHDSLPIPAMCPSEHRRLPPPTTTDNVERKLQALVVAVDKLIKKEQLRPSHEHNLSPADRRLLNVMKEDDNHYTLVARPWLNHA